MDGWTATVELLRWPVAVIISSLVLSRGLVAIAKWGSAWKSPPDAPF